MGEIQNQPFQLSFNTALKIDFQGSRVTSDGGLVLVREFAERLSQDPSFRLTGSEKIWDRGAALTFRLQPFETEMLGEEENFAGLGRLNRALIGKVEAMDSACRAVVRFYNKWGTAEQWIKEGKQAVKMTRLSCHRFRSNEVRLWLSLIAYNLGNLWRQLVLPKRIDNWSLTSLQQRLVKTGGRRLKHARYYWLLLAESHLTRRLFGAMVQRMAALTFPTG
jgi:hypothetical protein